jgi:hypothetical protein
MNHPIIELKRKIGQWQTIKRDKEKFVKAQQFELGAAARDREMELLDKCRNLIAQCRISGNLIVLRIEAEYTNFDYLHQVGIVDLEGFSWFLKEFGLPDVVLFNLYNLESGADSEYAMRIYEYAKRLIIFCVEEQKPLPKIKYSPNIYTKNKAKDLLTAFRQLTGIEEDDLVLLI